ncbi:hypothetical protein NNJEOMEG_01695 [Fundidesulfovibrio magnetotacticus]|uniref:Uncharacterized protein n=1 Tax=Fundidesulfovibrio magnetotacticus TaxID=2730080 RepID=A0A6V8LUS1_9BACT|nr:hypothetical protein NNJEOMEG_01695 [Fundidesulfovibrio magnetotacticus]
MSRAGDALDRRLAALPANPLLSGLDTRLRAFESALGAFAWPQARMVTGSGDAAGKIAGVTRDADQATPLVKIASGGFEASAQTSLAAGSYSFDLSLGPDTQTLNVDVASADTWGDVLGKVGDAVNQSPLAARADVVYQNAAFQQAPSMPGTGAVLALSVNPLRQDQDLRVSDRSGDLLAQLRLRAANRAVGPAQEAFYSVSGQATALPTFFSSTPTDPRAATTLATGRHDLGIATGIGPQASTYISKAFTPSDATTLAAGTYTFSSAYDGETRSHSVIVGSGWSWGDVLQAVGAELNGQPVWVKSASPTLSASSTAYSQPGVTASVGYWPIPSTTTPGAATDGSSLTVTGAAGKDFALADGAGGLLSSLGLTAKLTGTPVSFNVAPGDTWEDVYRSASVAIGGSQRSLGAATAGTMIPSTVTPGKDLHHQGAFLALTQLNQRIGERVSLTDGRTGVLDSLGVLSRERPGRDGMITVNGREMVSENDAFSLDQGRVLLGLESVYAEDVPLAVTSGMEATEKGWSGITDAWNSLSRYLRANEDQFAAGLGQRLEAPLASRAGDLRWMGVTTAGRTGQLWTNSRTFWSSFLADTDRARAALWAPATGLVPAWKAAASSVRAAGLESWLSGGADRESGLSFEASRPALTSEFQLEQKHRLMKLLG